MPRSRKVIYIKRNELEVMGVLLGKNPNSQSVNKFNWDAKTLPATLKKIKEDLNIKKARIVLDDELSYVIEMKIPGDVKNEREYVKQQLETKIPEKLEKYNWDFKELNRTDKERTIIAFAPVLEVWSSLKQGLTKANLDLEAIEPASIAQKRHIDPFVGIVIKEDIRGKDESVLNLKIDGQKNIKGSPNLPKTLFFILLILGLLAFDGYLIWTKVLNSKEPPPEITGTVEVPEELKSTISEEEQLAQLREDLRTSITIQILNGAGIAGAAGSAQSYLGELGYQDMQAGNADSYDYAQTIVSVKMGEVDILSMLLDDLSATYETTTSEEYLDSDNPFDAIIIIGKN